MCGKKLVIGREEIAGRIKELGRAISHDYAHRRLVVIGVLNGAFIFMADLVREIDLPLELDFVRAASYGDGRSSSGAVKFSKDVEISVTGRNILLVEDIIDTGRTIATLRDVLSARKPGSLRICALIDKKERREVDIEADYVGFVIDAGFLVGYGLDFAQRWRNYPAIYEIINHSE